MSAAGCAPDGLPLGEQIYREGRGMHGRLSYREGPRWLAHARLGCAACHGNAGEGRAVRAGAVTGGAPPLTPAVLAARGYDADGLRRAVVEGVDPAGRQLGYYMPRWELEEPELEALLRHLARL